MVHQISIYENQGGHFTSCFVGIIQDFWLYRVILLELAIFYFLGLHLDSRESIVLELEICAYILMLYCP